MGTKPTAREILLRQREGHQKALDEAVRQRQQIASELAAAQAVVSAAASRIAEVDEVLKALDESTVEFDYVPPSAGTAIQTVSVTVQSGPEPTDRGLVATFDEQDEDETPPKSEDR